MQTVDRSSHDANRARASWCWLVLATLGCNAAVSSVGSGTTGRGEGSSSVSGSVTSSSSGPAFGTVSTGTSSGGDGPTVGPVGSGDRLRARHLEAPGGARQFYAFYDSELEIDCRFHEVAPDEFFCLPWVDGPPLRRVVWELPDEHLPEVDSYLDNECTIPAIWVSGLSVELGDIILAKTFEAACELRPPQGTPVHLEAEGNVQWEPSLCKAVAEGKDILATTSGDDPMMSAIDVGTSPFVGAQLVDADGVRRLVAEDGAFEVVALLDHDERPCDIATFESDVCIPGVAVRAVNDEPGSCAVWSQPGGCTGTIPTHAVDPGYPWNGGTKERPGELRVWEVEGPCAGGTTFRLGRRLGPDELPILGRARVGDGDLVAEYHVGPFGAPTRFVRWWSESAQATCEVEEVEGAWRCGSVELALVTD